MGSLYAEEAKGVWPLKPAENKQRREATVTLRAITLRQERERGTHMARLPGVIACRSVNCKLPAALFLRRLPYHHSRRRWDDENLADL